MVLHWRHVAGHPARPAAPLKGAGWAAGHLSVTGTLKLTAKTITAAGQAMTAAGHATTWAGKRADKTSDSFIGSVILIGISVLIILIAIIAGIIVYRKM